MKIQTIIFISWLASAVLVGYLSFDIGRESGKAHYHERVQQFRSDVLSFAGKQSDLRIRDALFSVIQLTMMMPDINDYDMQKFEEEIKKLQSHSVQGTGESSPGP